MRFPGSRGSEAPSATVKQGQVEGLAFKTHKGEKAAKFLGIPYAAPPVGERRFALPEPAAAWDGVFKAKKSVQFAQYMLGSSIKGQEDGLVLNVYATEKVLAERDTSKAAVMFMIHGGAFHVGSGGPDIYGPEWMLDHGPVVIVGINYRLGPLGFLTTGDDVIPANLGLWDQRLALTWVKENIAAFGGDPDNVTILGESAGGTSCIYHMLSPRSAGLFHAAIAQSGVPNNLFARSDKHPAYYTRLFVKALGGDPTASSEDIKAFLMGLSAADILMKCTATKVEGDEEPLVGKDFFYFKPVMDTFCSQPFLPAEPLEVLKKGDFARVPVMAGFNKDEGLCLISTLGKDSEVYDKFKADWPRYCARFLLGRDSDELDDSDRKAAQILLERHFGGETPTYEAREAVMQAQTDAMFQVDLQEFCQALVNSPTEAKYPVYKYRYSYPSPLSFADFFTPMAKLAVRVVANKVGLDVFRGSQGACHLDECFMLWRVNMVPVRQRWSEADHRVSERMLAMWTNFAKKHNPTPDAGDGGEGGLGYKWEPVAAGDDNYLEIDGGETLKMWQDPREVESLKMWREIYEIVPRSVHLLRSPTWKDPVEPYRKQKEQEEAAKNENGGVEAKNGENGAVEKKEEGDKKEEVAAADN